MNGDELDVAADAAVILANPKRRQTYVNQLREERGEEYTRRVLAFALVIAADEMRALANRPAR